MAKRQDLPEWVRLQYVAGAPMRAILSSLQKQGVKAGRRLIERRARAEGWQRDQLAPPVATPLPRVPYDDSRREQWVRELETTLDEIIRSRRQAPLEYLQLVRQARAIAAEIMASGRFVREVVDGVEQSTRRPISGSELQRVMGALRIASLIEDAISGYIGAPQAQQAADAAAATGMPHIASVVDRIATTDDEVEQQDARILGWARAAIEEAIQASIDTHTPMGVAESSQVVGTLAKIVDLQRELTARASPTTGTGAYRLVESVVVPPPPPAEEEDDGQ